MTACPSWPRVPGAPGDRQTVSLPCGFAVPPLASVARALLPGPWLLLEVPVWEGEWSRAQVHHTGAQAHVCVRVPASAWRGSSTVRWGEGQGSRCPCCSLGTSVRPVGPVRVRHWPWGQHCAVPIGSRRQRCVDLFINPFAPWCCKRFPLTAAAVLSRRAEVAAEDFREARALWCVCTCDL